LLFHDFVVVAVVFHDFVVVAVSDNKKEITSDWEWLESHLLNTLCEHNSFLVTFLLVTYILVTLL